MGTERARRGLLATGEIARLVRDGLTNPDTSAQLFLSPRTVEWHLGKVFAKLGISPRRQLRGRCPALARVALPSSQTSACGPGRPPGPRRIRWS